MAAHRKLKLGIEGIWFYITKIFNTAYHLRFTNHLHKTFNINTIYIYLYIFQ